MHLFVCGVFFVCMRIGVCVCVGGYRPGVFLDSSLPFFIGRDSQLNPELIDTTRAY